MFFMSTWWGDWKNMEKKNCTKNRERSLTWKHYDQFGQISSKSSRIDFGFPQLSKWKNWTQLILRS